MNTGPSPACHQKTHLLTVAYKMPSVTGAARLLCVRSIAQMNKLRCPSATIQATSSLSNILSLLFLYMLFFRSHPCLFDTEKAPLKIGGHGVLLSVQAALSQPAALLTRALTESSHSLTYSKTSYLEEILRPYSNSTLMELGTPHAIAPPLQSETCCSMQAAPAPKHLHLTH